MNRNTAWLDALLVHLRRHFRPHARFPGRVVSQRPNGMLEVRPDSDAVGSHDMVPLRLGLPGVTAKVPAGARVVLAFAEGDPKKPFAELTETALPIELKVDAQNIILNGGTAQVGRVGDAVAGPAVGSLWDTFFQGLALATGQTINYNAAKVTSIGSIAAGAPGVKA